MSKRTWGKVYEIIGDKAASASNVPTYSNLLPGMFSEHFRNLDFSFFWHWLTLPVWHVPLKAHLHSWPPQIPLAKVHACTHTQTHTHIPAGAFQCCIKQTHTVSLQAPRNGTPKKNEPAHDLMRADQASGFYLSPLILLSLTLSPLPSILLANVQSMENKIDDLNSRLICQWDIQNCNIGTTSAEVVPSPCSRGIRRSMSPVF